MRFGSWQEIRKLHKPATIKQGRIKDSADRLVDSSQRAEVFADYLETVQWAVRPEAISTEDPARFEILPISEDIITEEEICSALQQLHLKKSAGHDGLSPEFWKVCANSKKIVSWIATMCNSIYMKKDIPAEWHIAKIECLYKKGDPAVPENYRPISLLPVVFALNRPIMSK